MYPRGCCEITVALLLLLAVLRVLSSSRRLATLISQQPLRALPKCKAVSGYWISLALTPTGNMAGR